VDADPRENDVREEISPRLQQVHAWADDPRVSATERKKILSYGANSSDPQNGDGSIRKARDVFARAVLTPEQRADREATLVVNRLIESITRCRKSIGGLDALEVASAIVADPANQADFEAVISMAYDVLDKIDEITMVVRREKLPQNA